MSLNSLRDYLNNLTWVENGNLTQDLTQVIELLEADLDSRWFVKQTRQGLAVVHFWDAKIRYAIRQYEMQIALSADRLDAPAREALKTAKRYVKQRSINAYVMNNPDHKSLVDALSQYELVLGVIEGISLALDNSLVVQEAVSVRRQEQIDAGQI